MRIDEIVNHVFTRAFMGYDIEQVDVFLDEIIETLERYEAEKREMLAAMEYLMKKLEHGQKVPLADMKKAIDSGIEQGNIALPGGANTREDDQKPAARSITRGNGANKPIRAPKVNRVKREEEAKAQIIEEAKAAIPLEELTQEEADRRAKRMSAAAVNWLDELLINIAEHETQESEKPASAPQQTQPATEPKTAPTPVPQPTPKATYTPTPATQPPAPKPQEQQAKPTEPTAQQQQNDPATVLQKVFDQADHADE
ncbi:MAG TPA: DivIVA domain-containing protein [Clostridia bacterium]|nr:DivIVA domain-containing protein [Clostridia bacterium]